jgi:aspartyl-tRNA(Asn)/glutamyl-tRNA(Gln) amidotransferase subunit B
MNDKLLIESIIGLEVHVELKTNSKMFCGCSASFFGQKPNTHCCPVCLGLPGALPVPNKKAIENCIKIGLALSCKVNEESYFERKSYFYPDLPKGYQISQYSKPLSYGGVINIGGKNDKQIRINRVHMEEDTGKLSHITIENEKCSLIDFNRSGVPLVEIVTEPDFRNCDDVILYLKKLQRIIRFLEVSDCDMEKGSMRLEPTINLKITRSKNIYFTPLVEIKNINSFRFVKQALEYEIERQSVEFRKTGITKSSGNKTTAGFDEDKKTTFIQRSKEEANDYRYFPEPDIPPMRFTKIDIENLKTQIELPDAKIIRFEKDYGLSEYDANILCGKKELAEYYEESLKSQELKTLKSVTPKIVANWLINKKINYTKLLPSEFIQKIISVSQNNAISDDELKKIIRKIIKNNPKAVSDYKSGKNAAMMFLVGQTIREVGKFKDANKLIDLIKHLLND